MHVTFQGSYSSKRSLLLYEVSTAFISITFPLPIKYVSINILQDNGTNDVGHAQHGILHAVPSNFTCGIIKNHRQFVSLVSTLCCRYWPKLLNIYRAIVKMD